MFDIICCTNNCLNDNNLLNTSYNIELLSLDYLCFENELIHVKLKA